MTFINIYICISFVIALALTLSYNHFIHKDEKFFKDLDEQFGDTIDLKSYSLLPVLFLMVTIFWIPIIFSKYIDKFFKKGE